MVDKKNQLLIVQGIKISLFQKNEEDYICITDMIKGKESERPDMIIQNWLRNKDTIEFLGLWESLNNPDFKPFEFEGFRKNAGTNRFSLTPKVWIEATNAIGVISKAGRYGGTYAHKDIAFEFGTWISPVFKLYLIKEYQHLKEVESNQYNIEWNVKRVLSKANYQLHTDAINKYIIPKLTISQKKEWIYADEADMLNIIMFGCTAKQWREVNPQRVLNGENIRDMASINELAILSNMETLNSALIKQGIDRRQRARILSEMAKEQKKVLDSYDYVKSVRKTSDSTLIDVQRSELSLFDKSLKRALDYNPHKDNEKNEEKV